MSINKNNKNFQITLEPESAKILETLAKRYKTTKSIIIKNALKVYASKKKHYITLAYYETTLQEVEQTEQITNKKVTIPETPMTEEDKEQWNNMLNDLHVEEE